MALGDSVVAICNIGLISGLGQDPIASLDDNRKAAILCKARYDQVRRNCLRAYPWGFATTYAQCPAHVTQPPFGGGIAFTLPADFIRVAGLPDRDNPKMKYKVRGRTLVIDMTPPLNLEYVFDCTDPTLFDPLFVETLGYALAAEIAEPLTQSAAKANAALAKLEGKLTAAQRTSEQDGSEDEWDVDVLLRVRNI